MAVSFLSFHSLPSIRSKTATLVLACALPTIVGFAALSYDSFQRERENLLRDAERIAENLLLAVERELDAGETAARALSSSPSLGNGDLNAFHYQARSILGPGYPGFAFVLSDTSGKPVLNTRIAYGKGLPLNDHAAVLRRVAASGDVMTSDLYQIDASEPHAVSVDVPVWNNAVVAYVLSAQLRPQRFNDLMAQQHLPPRWTAQLFDREHTFVARSHDAQRYIGSLGRPDMVAATARSNSGMVELTSREGVHMLASYKRSAKRGWYVTIGVPRDSAFDALRDSLAGVFLSVAALLVVGLATAWTIGGVIGRAVSSLRAPAAALGRGEPMLLPPMKIREVSEVAAAMQKVQGELLRYRNELESLVAGRTSELERANALLKTVYATAPVGLALLDCELRFVMVNDYLAAINGLPVADHLGRTLPELLGTIGEEYEKPYRKVRDSGVPLPAVETSGPVPSAPGVDGHWIVSYDPVFGSDQKLVGISAVVHDISERKVLSQRLRDVNEQFRALYEMSGDAHMLLAQGAGFISGNLAAARIFGCSSIEEFLTLSPAISSPEFQPDGRRSSMKAQQFIGYAIETGSHHFEWVHRRRNGELFHADVLLTSLNIGGKGILQATVRDISERIAAERVLRATSARLQQREAFIRTVTDNVPGMVGYWDGDLHCQFANRLYMEWFGRTEEQMIGQPMHEIFSAELLADNAPYLREVMAGREAHFGRELEKASGDKRHVWVNYIPDLDDSNQVRGFYVLISDISELKRSELRLQSLNEQLVHALDKAQMASSAKSEFLANMSHEIRTPMNAIMGLARLLEEAPLARRERGYVAKIKMSTRSLLGILNDVLDFSKIEAGQLMLEYTSFKLDQVLNSISVLVASNASAKGVELVYAIAPDVPQELVGDQMRLEQVLLNLISNAIKFTDRGEVVLSISLHQAGPDADVLAFAVRDTGIGIAPHLQASMFDAFSQGDTSTSRRFGGAGLGLAICRRLVSLMGGSIAVTSELGQGAQFGFACSFGRVAHSTPLALPALPGMQELSVLVVDNNPSVSAAIGAQCEAFGWRVQHAANGAMALDLLRTSAREQRHYDLVFLDSAMPELDGISVLTYARADPSIAMPHCILMVEEESRERLMALADDLKLDAILSKPITPEALLGAVVELLTGQPAVSTDQGPASLAGRLQGIYVLLVEDNVINQEVANYILLHAGAAVDIAANGRGIL